MKHFNIDFIFLTKSSSDRGLSEMIKPKSVKKTRKEAARRTLFIVQCSLLSEMWAQFIPEQRRHNLDDKEGNKRLKYWRSGLDDVMIARAKWLLRRERPVYIVRPEDLQGTIRLTRTTFIISLFLQDNFNLTYTWYWAENIFSSISLHYLLRMDGKFIFLVFRDMLERDYIFRLFLWYLEKSDYEWYVPCLIDEKYPTSNIHFLNVFQTKL